MNEKVGNLLAVGNVAEVFEWGARVVKLYKSIAAKPAAFREAAITRGRRSNGAAGTKGLERPRDRRSMGSCVQPGGASLIRGANVK